MFQLFLCVSFFFMPLLFYPVALFKQCLSIYLCVCPDEEAGYSCLHRCHYGGIVDNKAGHQPAAKMLMKAIL